jgi:hypothetical protein
MKKVLFLLCCPALGLLLTGCVSFEPPRIEHTGTAFTPLSFQELQARSNFTIKNSNPIALGGTVQYELYINGREFSTGVSSTIEVGPSAQSTFHIDSRIDLVKVFGVAADLAGAIAAGKTSVPYEIRGKFRSGVLGVAVEAPVRASGTIPLPKPTDVESIIKTLIK